MTQLELDFGEEFARPQEQSRQDKIIELAIAAGMLADGDMWFSRSYENCDVHINELERFAQLVEAAERKRICKQIAMLHDSLSLASDPTGLKTK